MADSGGRAYQLVGRGSDLGILVTGPTPEACLTAAVEALAASLADVDPAAPRHRAPVALTGEGPAELLVALLDDAIVRLDVDGHLTVTLVDAQLRGARLEGELELVELASVTVHGVAPKVATWHDLRLEPVGDRWEGEVTLDL